MVPTRRPFASSTPLANMKQATASARETARRTQHNFQRAHGRLMRVQVVAAENQPRFLLSLLLPPLGVFFELGFAPEVVLNVLLTVLGFVPGMLHVLYILTSD